MNVVGSIDKSGNDSTVYDSVIMTSDVGSTQVTITFEKKIRFGIYFKESITFFFDTYLVDFEYNPDGLFKSIA